MFIFFRKIVHVMKVRLPTADWKDQHSGPLFFKNLTFQNPLNLTLISFHMFSLDTLTEVDAIVPMAVGKPSFAEHSASYPTRTCHVPVLNRVGNLHVTRTRSLWNVGTRKSLGVMGPSVGECARNRCCNKLSSCV